MNPTGRLLLGAVSAAALLSSASAWACSVCGCGDPLLSANDPAAVNGRLRLQIDTEYLSVKSGAPSDKLDQYTLRANGVYSPAPGLSFIAQVPFTRKNLNNADGSGSDLSGLGDVELGARYTVLDPPTSPRSAGRPSPPRWAARCRPARAARASTGMRWTSTASSHGGLGPLRGAALPLRAEAGDGLRERDGAPPHHELRVVPLRRRRPVERPRSALPGLAGRARPRRRRSPRRRRHAGGARRRGHGRDRPRGFTWCLLERGGAGMARAPPQLPFYSRLDGIQSVGPTVVGGSSTWCSDQSVLA